MKPLKVFSSLLLLLMMLFEAHPIFAINANEIATIDMRLAVSLHPKMALYDYNRMGFYKVNLGLSDEEFKKAVEKLKKSPKDIKAEKEKLISELKTILAQRDELDIKQFAQRTDITPEYTQKVSELSIKENELRTKINDLEWSYANPELTSREETRAIMSEIKTDINNAIMDIVLDKKYLLVLNSSLIVPYKFSLKFLDLIYGQGMPGFNFSLFYSFYWRNMLYIPPETKANYSKLQRWARITRQSVNLDSLPISYYPIVLAGGKNILPDTLKIIYSKYNIEPSILETVASVTERIECLQKGKQIEKLVVILDEK